MGERKMNDKNKNKKYERAEGTRKKALSTRRCCGENRINIDIGFFAVERGENGENMNFILVI
jgi:hypothetical protein